jgi:hypothetical protein
VEPGDQGVVIPIAVGPAHASGSWGTTCLRIGSALETSSSSPRVRGPSPTSTLKTSTRWPSSGLARHSLTPAHRQCRTRRGIADVRASSRDFSEAGRGRAPALRAFQVCGSRRATDVVLLCLADLRKRLQRRKAQRVAHDALQPVTPVVVADVAGEERRGVLPRLAPPAEAPPEATHAVAVGVQGNAEPPFSVAAHHQLRLDPASPGQLRSQSGAKQTSVREGHVEPGHGACGAVPVDSRHLGTAPSLTVDDASFPRARRVRDRAAVQLRGGLLRAAELGVEPGQVSDSGQLGVT